MTQDTTFTAQKCATQALETMDALGHTPYPWVYELWFNYHSNTEREMNDEIDVRGKENIPMQDYLSIYAHYIGQRHNAIRTLTARFNEETELLKHANNTDPLTNVSSRAYLTKHLANMRTELDNSNEDEFCLVMLDVDHFKRVNDNYGHLAGDKCLHTLGGVLKDEIKGRDIVGRYGGEEFVIVLSSCNEEEAARFAEKLRARIEDTPIQLDGDQELYVTISGGIASSMDHESIHEQLDAADQALYKAKSNGRNQIYDHNSDTGKHENYNVNLTPPPSANR